jgi:hypothetical protein
MRLWQRSRKKKSEGGKADVEIEIPPKAAVPHHVFCIKPKLTASGSMFCRLGCFGLAPKLKPHQALTYRRIVERSLCIAIDWVAWPIESRAVRGR